LVIPGEVAMSEEDAFLDGIAADRADRTRLLVFADWLAERSDPREEFVRLHAKLLDVDGTEPEFAELDKEWNRWVGSGSGPRHRSPESGLLTDRWLDAVCRVCTSADLEPYLRDSNYAWTSASERTEHECANPWDTVVLYHGLAHDFAIPLEFLAGTILIDIGGDEWFQGSLAECYPITRGAFWRLWREQRDALLQPPPLPETAPGNHFLGAQYLGGGWGYWAIVAVYQHDCFALFWTTTD
jgi:uncharacterized protein (TIGR02996 family)